MYSGATFFVASNVVIALPTFVIAKVVDLLRSVSKKKK